VYDNINFIITNIQLIKGNNIIVELIIVHFGYVNKLSMLTNLLLIELHDNLSK